MLPFLLARANLTLQFAFSIAERGRSLEVLVAHGGVLLGIHGVELRLQFGNFRRRHLRGQPRAGTGLIDDVNRLVGQETIGDVPLGQLRGERQRLVRNRDAVVVLVTLAKPPEDFDGLVHRRWFDHDGLEPPFECAVLFDVLPVLVERRRAHALQLTTGQRRLQHVAGVNRAFGGARTNQRMQLVDEQDDVLVLGDFIHYRLQALFELPAILCAGNHSSHVERQHPVVAQRIGACAVRDELCETLHDGSFANPRLADKNWIVLLPSREHFHHAFDFFLTPDGRVQLALARELREVPAEMIERWRLRLLLPF